MPNNVEGLHKIHNTWI